MVCALVIFSLESNSEVLKEMLLLQICHMLRLEHLLMILELLLVLVLHLLPRKLALINRIAALDNTNPSGSSLNHTCIWCNLVLANVRLLWHLLKQLLCCTSTTLREVVSKDFSLLLVQPINLNLRELLQKLK